MPLLSRLGSVLLVFAGSAALWMTLSGPAPASHAQARTAATPPAPPRAQRPAATPDPKVADRRLRATAAALRCATRAELVQGQGWRHADAGSARARDVTVVLQRQGTCGKAEKRKHCAAPSAPSTATPTLTASGAPRHGSASWTERAIRTPSAGASARAVAGATLHTRVPVSTASSSPTVAPCARRSESGRRSNPRRDPLRGR